MSMNDSSARVWDLPTRLFHWTLVGLIALQYASGEFGWLSMEWHFRLGYATLALIAFRVLWGFFGSQTSRFGDFLRGPRIVSRYAADLMRGKAGHAAGHNPLGGWSVVAMLACVFVQAVSGLFTSDDISEDGPFVGAVSNSVVRLASRVHSWGETVLVVLIVLHVAAVLLHWLLKRDNLVAPMFSGRKPGAETRSLRFASGWLALALLIVAIAAVFVLSRYGD